MTFGELFGRGAVDTSDSAWLQAMLDTEAALARAAERAGLAPAGSGAAVTAAARPEFIDNAGLRTTAAAANSFSASSSLRSRSSSAATFLCAT